MRVEKEKRRVSIICHDGSMVKGTIHINPGERPLDFFNDQKEAFIPVTDAEVFNAKGNLIVQKSEKKTTVILNKTAIRLVEEI